MKTKPLPHESVFIISKMGRWSFAKKIRWLLQRQKSDIGGNGKEDIGCCNEQTVVVATNRYWLLQRRDVGCYNEDMLVDAKIHKALDTVKS
eukprot:m.200067 g.200067  ORF g.200067 m.200067 type:complete len:91 (-) comp32759_c0_seq4:292-564(-)